MFSVRKYWGCMHLRVPSLDTHVVRRVTIFAIHLYTYMYIWCFCRMETIGSDSSLLQTLIYCFSDRVDKVREEALALQLIQSPPASMRRGDHRATSASTSAAQLNSFGLVDAMTLVVKQLHKKHQRERLVREGGGGGGCDPPNLHFS